VTGTHLTAREWSWAGTGTRLLLDGMSGLPDDELDGPSALPGWTRRHLLAHVASNAEALLRLLGWARTGVENRMYASAEQRSAEIELGAARGDLRERVRDSAQRLDAAVRAMPDAAWQSEVVTAQGRTVPAREVLWMRARETCVHAVDLRCGTGFADLPPAFLVALIEEVVGRRSARPGPSVLLRTASARYELPGYGPQQVVELPQADAAAWLVGRTPAGPASGLPELPPWL
jgi:maleylpyruvate isomerase